MSEEHETESVTDVEVVEPRVTSESARKLAVRRKIEDAQELWSKLKDTLHQEQFDGSKEEEYEDSHGNVLSRATYEDLAGQGLL